MKDDGARPPYSYPLKRSGTPADVCAGMVDAAHDAIICADARGRIILWNGGAERLFGYGASEALGRSLDIIIPEAMRGEHANGMRRLANGGSARIIGEFVEVPTQRADGSPLTVEMRVSAWLEGGEMRFGAILRDASDRREARERLDSLAHYDQMTMLPNRNLFLERLQDAIGEGEPEPLSLLLLEFYDLADFAEATDEAAVDNLLRATGVALKQIAGSSERSPTVARTGTEQFAMIVPGEGDILAASVIADSMLRAARGVASAVVHAPVPASVGVTVCPEHGSTPAKLVANASFALRRARHEGGDRRQIFLPAHRRAAVARRELEAELAQALASKAFEVFYQPQVSLADRRIVGAEALVRWRHPERGVLGPVAFLHAVEDTRLAEPLGDWILETACREAARLRDETGEPLRIGVNLFERQLVRGDMPARTQRILAETGLRPEDLELEITETVMTASDEAAVRRVRRLRDLGVGIAFDDYGTGYASLSLLKRYPLTRLKIDRSFVRDLSVDDEDAAIIELIISLGERFGLSVTGEGVETVDQEARLKALGCDDGQGYLFGRPMPAEAFRRMLIQSRRSRRRVLVA